MTREAVAFMKLECWGKLHYIAIVFTEDQSNRKKDDDGEQLYHPQSFAGETPRDLISKLVFAMGSFPMNQSKSRITLLRFLQGKANNVHDEKEWRANALKVITGLPKQPIANMQAGVVSDKTHDRYRADFG